MKNLFLHSWVYQSDLKKLFKYFLVGLGLLLICTSSYASSVGNLPFNGPMDIFESNFIKFCFSAAVVLFMATCVTLALGEWGDGIKRFINILFFISLALGAPSGVALLFGTGATF